MFDILKRNYIDIFCYTNSKTAYDYFPIDYAREFIPKWWKDIPNDLHSQNDDHKSESSKLPTMKRCPGIIEHYKKGFMMPLWTDIEIIVGNNETVLSIADKKTQYNSHPNYQKGEFLSDGNWKHLKLLSPWRIETPKNIGFNRMQPHWSLNHLNKNIMIPNSYTDYFFNHSVNPQMFVNTLSKETITLAAGTPLAHLVPLTEKKIKLHVMYDKEKYDNCNGPDRISFIGNYYKIKQMYKSRLLKNK